jgi:hypothetical protein
MAKFAIEKTNFTAGEISPWLFGRGDLRAYENGAQRLSNVFIHPTGGVYRRPGLRFVDQAPGLGRLLSFEFNTDQTYLLAFFDGLVSIYQDDSKIAELEAPWTEAQLRQINWTQSADTLLIVHPDVKPKKITRTGGSVWELLDWSFFATDERVSCPHHNFTGPNVTVQASALSATITITASDAIFDSNHIGTRFRIENKETLITKFLSSTEVEAEVKETLTSLDATADWTEQAFSEVRGWPTSVCFHQDRLVIGGSRDLPNNLWLSKSADLFNFETGDGLDDEAISFPILSDQVNAIRHVFSGRHLQVFTSGAEWMVTGDPLAPTTIQLHRQTRIGSPTVRTVPPKDVDGATLFTSRDGSQLREFVFTDTEQAYQAADLTMLAHHLINTPVDIDFDLSSRLFHMVMLDGSLATLTIYRDENVTAWTRQETHGKFQAVSVLGDRTYVLVERQNGHSIEVFDRELNTDAALTGSSETPTTQWTGLYHLESQAVKVVADNKRIDDMKVSAGAVKLSESAITVEVGLGFSHIIEPLAPAINQFGSRIGVKIRPIKYVFRLQNTATLKVDTGKGLHEVSSRRLGNNNFIDTPSVINGDVQIRALGWRQLDTKPLWRIEQDVPLSFILLAVSLEVSAIR